MHPSLQGHEASGGVVPRGMLTPEELARFEQTGENPDEPRLCVMCARLYVSEAYFWCQESRDDRAVRNVVLNWYVNPKNCPGRVQGRTHDSARRVRRRLERNVRTCRVQLVSQDAPGQARSHVGRRSERAPLDGSTVAIDPRARSREGFSLAHGIASSEPEQWTNTMFTGSVLCAFFEKRMRGENPENLIAALFGPF